MPDHYKLFPHGANASSALYGIFVLTSIILSLRYWLKSTKADERLLMIYFGALAGALLGAKLAYMLSEGWIQNQLGDWKYWLIGKSVTGALLGGFLGVECTKKLVSYNKATGDKFGLIIPFGIITGRLGCLSHGCCGGVLLDSGKHWPAVQVEISFNLIIWAILYIIRNKPFAKNQLFHIYLITYGVFRFFHEFMRATPKLIQGFSGYQFIAVALVLVGAIAYCKRNKPSYCNTKPHE